MRESNKLLFLSRTRADDICECGPQKTIPRTQTHTPTHTIMSELEGVGEAARAGVHPVLAVCVTATCQAHLANLNLGSSLRHHHHRSGPAGRELDHCSFCVWADMCKSAERQDQSKCAVAFLRAHVHPHFTQTVVDCFIGRARDQTFRVSTSMAMIKLSTCLPA